MKYYYGLKVLLLNISSKFVPVKKAPLWFINWYLKMYFYNLDSLVLAIGDEEAHQRITEMKTNYEKES